ncbi:hypothetical protein Taro_001657 [Colocasia esculenta]|uniref:Uncharacterized protein n=1 Tax=Colocasia esculenta TaxID=4460 RepID=A0A843TBN4_COLES|nr:hypothetical protein [Colocasia esculenta]
MFSGKASSVDTLSQISPKGILGRPLVSTLLDLVSTHCPILAQQVFWELSLVSTLLDLVSTLLDQFCIILPCVVMRNQWSPMGPGKSDEHPLYEELTV